MATVKLDTSKLLGYRLDQSAVACGIKQGVKVGSKGGGTTTRSESA